LRKIFSIGENFPSKINWLEEEERKVRGKIMDDLYFVCEHKQFAVCNNRLIGNDKTIEDKRARECNNNKLRIIIWAGALKSYLDLLLM
jgi:hypothetical protein